VRPPGAALFLVLRHLHLVQYAPTLPPALGCAWGDRLRSGVLLQHGLQALEQAGFVGISERELHLSAFKQNVTIGAGWRLGQGRWCWRGLRLDLAGDIFNRLRVFKIANTAHLGRGVGQERWLRMGPSENYVAR